MNVKAYDRAGNAAQETARIVIPAPNDTVTSHSSFSIPPSSLTPPSATPHSAFTIPHSSFSIPHSSLTPPSATPTATALDLMRSAGRAKTRKLVNG